MMGARDRAGEILEMKRRNPKDFGYLSYGLLGLRDRWRKIDGNPDSVPDFYLIRAVTILEVSTRQEIARLIDHSKDFTDRAVELSKNFKMDFEMVRDIHGRAITLGDIVAHSIPVSTFGQILGYFETLLGKPLRPLLEGAVDRWRTEIEKNPSGPLIPDFYALRKRLSRLFEVRHILCHELPEKPVYAVGEVSDFLDSAIQFTQAIEAVLTFEKFSLVPLTQTDMNIAASRRLRERDEELNTLLAKVRGRIATHNKAPRTPEDDRNNWVSHLDGAQQDWLRYRNAHCEFVTYLNKGGTIRPLLWASEAFKMTEARIDEIQSWFDSELTGLALDLE